MSLYEKGSEINRRCNWAQVFSCCLLILVSLDEDILTRASLNQNVCLGMQSELQESTKTMLNAYKCLKSIFFKMMSIPMSAILS